MLISEEYRPLLIELNYIYAISLIIGNIDVDFKILPRDL